MNDSQKREPQSKAVSLSASDLPKAGMPVQSGVRGGAKKTVPNGPTSGGHGHDPQGVGSINHNGCLKVKVVKAG
jgi:hypothetical protein